MNTTHINTLHHYVNTHYDYSITSGSSPEFLLAAGCQMTVDESEGGAIEHKGHAHRSLVPCIETHMSAFTCELAANGWMLTSSC